TRRPSPRPRPLSRRSASSWGWSTDLLTGPGRAPRPSRSEAARAAGAGEAGGGESRGAGARRGGVPVGLQRGVGRAVPRRVPQHRAEVPEARVPGPGGLPSLPPGTHGAVPVVLDLVGGLAQHLRLVLVLGDPLDAMLRERPHRGGQLA